MRRFRDRTDAGRRLAVALAGYAGRDAVVLALPRGGVPVAAEVATALHAPLDLVLVRKIGLPDQPELAMGAVVDGAAPIVVRNADILALGHVDKAAFDTACRRELAEIERRRARYIGARPRAPIAGRVVIVVDDGIATGATVKAALEAVRQRGPTELVLAVPVAPADALAELTPEVDACVCLLTPEPFGAIGYFYDDFTQVTDGAVEAALARCPVARPGADQRA
ncbi:phosphoribosyltransferase [Xanthobacter agilis]|uniref:Phosphoribosyltransferase n=1 Tax=Xanthobacter agilis TaxID=47492 RepID=A0ABU0LC09_XANAG|nr:phosphoribosyltransferase [Xanthobacter agilis]MDQ0504643.1 putative phosphoribosyltransferase [Xanthobacter agilis]